MADLISTATAELAADDGIVSEETLGAVTAAIVNCKAALEAPPPESEPEDGAAA